MKRVVFLSLIILGTVLSPIQHAQAQYSGCPNNWGLQLPSIQLKVDQFGRSRFSFPGENYSSTSPRVTLSRYVPVVDRYIQSLKQNAVGYLSIQVSDAQDFRRSYVGSEKLMSKYYAGVVPFWGPIIDDEDSGIFDSEPINPWIRLQVRIDVKNCSTAYFNSNGIQIVGETYKKTNVPELDRMASAASATYRGALNSVGEFQLDLSKALVLSDSEIASLDLKITDANSRIAQVISRINDPQTAESMKRTLRSSLVSWNSALKSYEERRSSIDLLKRFLQPLPALVRETKISSWNSETNRKLFPVQATPTPEAVSPTTARSAQSSIEGQSCKRPGETKSVGASKFACLIVGKKYLWTALNQKNPSGSTRSSEPSKKPTPTTSEADNLAMAGCKAFPSAIVRLQNSSGSGYNPAFLAAQEAASKIAIAARLDGKYGVLSNAQSIIIQYAQAVGWGGKGYSGDINTVRTAVATLNASCGSNLKLR
jgi:hypothetical protein